MILFELKAIGVNLLFGMFFAIMINTLSLYEVKIKNKIIINLFYFILTIFCGIIYIIYLDLILFSFNYNFPLFIIFGFFIANRFYQLKPDKYIPIFNYLVIKTIKIIKKVFLFLINYSLWRKIKLKIKKSKKH